MKRWLTLLILLIPCAGCTMIEDMLFVDHAPGYPGHLPTAQHPNGSCGAQTPFVAAAQTVEPELLQVRK